MFNINKNGKKKAPQYVQNPKGGLNWYAWVETAVVWMGGHK